MTWHFVLCYLKHIAVSACVWGCESPLLWAFMYIRPLYRKHLRCFELEEEPQLTFITEESSPAFFSLYFPLSWCMSLFLFVISPSISSIPLVSGSGGSCSSCGPARVWVCPDHLSWGSVCSADSASVCVPCSIGAWPTSQPGWRPTPGL